jgi:hypothetical protein
MKLIILATSLLLSVASYSQKQLTAYVELRGTVDALENVYIEPIVKPKRLENQIDSLIDYNEINSKFPRSNTANNVINFLSLKGWSLVSVTQISSDKESRPASPFILYYFKKQFLINDKR